MPYAYRSHLLASFVFVAVGCGGTPGDGSTGTSTGDASTGGASTTSGGSSTTTGGDLPTTTEAGSGTVEPPGDTTSGTSTGDASSGTGSSSGGGSGSTTDGLECSLEDQACALAATDPEAIDCGVLDLDAAADVWQAGHDCALQAATMGKSFKLITFLQGIDSEVAQAYCGFAGEEYVVEVFFFDSDPCGGGDCGPKIVRAVCGGSLIESEGCVVAPSEVCLTCDAQGDVLEVCEGD